jgi:uncharacterized transporter YbjL
MIAFLGSAGLLLGLRLPDVDPSLLAGWAAVAIVTGFLSYGVTLLVCRWVLPGSPFQRNLGILSGSLNNPGLSDFVSSRAGNGVDVAAPVFAVAYPVGMAAKILVAAMLMP